MLPTAPDAPTEVSATTATDLPASPVSTLSGQYHTDPAVSPLGRTRVSETAWSCAVRSSEHRIGTVHDRVTQRLADRALRPGAGDERPRARVAPDERSWGATRTRCNEGLRSLPVAVASCQVLEQQTASGTQAPAGRTGGCSEPPAATGPTGGREPLGACRPRARGATGSGRRERLGR
ncbi:hypothetical protein SAMN04488546_1495 [Geodermatophilus poikilotrophus]|uniref:Uncharacterized protein n=1 Tax=Geodermatophilus poikilotrophus TaxID=1333667 RepID=A0A1I0BYD3_9ACTN|nr:hypothetical protein SAMN04488546_1495 [Geodermatophilus poikilotrophus]